MGGKTGTRYAGLTTMERSGPLWTGETRVAEDLLAWPLFRRRPRRIAVNVMSDLFHENLVTETIDLVHAVMAVAHWHRFLVLTKRAERMHDYYNDPETPRRIADTVNTLSSVALPAARLLQRAARGVDPTGDDRSARSRRGSGLDRGADAPGVSTAIRRGALYPWPLTNLWLGVSVEDQERMARVRDLLQTPAAIRWVCFEPLLDGVSPDAMAVGDGYFDALAGGHYIVDGRGRAVSVQGPAWRPLDWVVIGGEIGAGARPMLPHWVRELRDKCVATNVPFFFKQWGEWAPVSKEGSDQSMSRVGKRAAGRLLDGRTWDEIPTTARAE
jgi:protein gp37